MGLVYVTTEWINADTPVWSVRLMWLAIIIRMIANVLLLRKSLSTYVDKEVREIPFLDGWKGYHCWYWYCLDTSLRDPGEHRYQAVTGQD